MIGTPPCIVGHASGVRSVALTSHDSEPRAAALGRTPTFQAGRKSADRPNWLREIKFDGYRMAARIDSGKVQLLTRSGLDWTAKYPTTEVRRETSSF
jgi:ATP-dependent DNA ligase